MSSETPVEVGSQEIRIERVIPNPTVPPAYVNAVFSSRLGDDLVLDFAFFDPADFHKAKEQEGSGKVGAWVAARILLSKLSIGRLRQLLDDFEAQLSADPKSPEATE